MLRQMAAIFIASAPYSPRLLGGITLINACLIGLSSINQNASLIFILFLPNMTLRQHIAATSNRRLLGAAVAYFMLLLSHELYV